MKRSYYLLFIIIFITTSLFAQEVEKKEQKTNIKYSSKNVGSTQAVEGDIIFSDGANPLLRITDEGDFGTIQMSNGIPSNKIFKLYNDNGTLYFNGNALGSSNSLVDSLGDLSDAKTDFSSIFVGREAGLNDDGGLSDGNTNNNAAFGKSALKSNTSGSSNTSIGNSSLLNNITGIGNVAVGNSSLGFNTSGFNNIAIGVRSLYLNSTGYFNVGLGYQVGYYNQEGINNTFLGTEAGKGEGPHSKSGGVFIGYQAGFNEENDNKLYINNDSSSKPLIWGDFTDGQEIVRINGDFHVSGDLTSDGALLGSKDINDLGDAISDSSDIFVGYNSGINNNGENSNTAVGIETLKNNSSGSTNIAIGNEAMLLNETGSRNVAIGTSALRNNETGSHTVAIGYASQRNMSTSDLGSYNYNTSIGYESIKGGGNITENNGNYNVAVGYRVLKDITNGSNNTGVGHNSLYLNSSGEQNTACGSFSLFQNTTGSGNTGIGVIALNLSTTGDDNTAIGKTTLYSNTTGSDNSALGASALAVNITGNENTAIGSGSGPSAGFFNLNNTTAIGFEAKVANSNQVRVGNSSVTSIGGYAPWSNLSDGRFKRNLKEDIKGIDFIKGLKPVSFNYEIEAIADKLGENIENDENGNKIQTIPSAQIQESRAKKSGKRQIGFIAQEVEELANSIGFEFSGVERPENEQSMYRLRYAEFVVPLVKAIQEQQEMIEELKIEIDEFKKQK